MGFPERSEAGRQLRTARSTRHFEDGETNDFMEVMLARTWRQSAFSVSSKVDRAVSWTLVSEVK